MINSKPKVIDSDENKQLKVLILDGKIKVTDLKVEDNIMKFQRQIYSVIIKENDDTRDI